MEIQLINGGFTIEEAEQLLTNIFKVKLAFHEQKIRTVHHTEEDIKHSENRIIQLERTLRTTIQNLKATNQQYINIKAHIELNFPPHIGQ